MPSPTAWWIAAVDSASSCRPQPPCQPPPPIAQAPRPTRVISKPVEPSSAVGRGISSARPGEPGCRALSADGGLAASHQPIEDRERLGNDLIHVVVLVRREAADELHLGCLVGERLVLLVELGVLGARNGIVGIPFRPGIFPHHGRLRMLLAGE